MKKYSIKGLACLMMMVMVLNMGLVGCGKKDAATATDKSVKAEVKAEEKTETAEVKEVVIKYGLWGSEEEINIWREVAKDCESEYPGVKIEIQTFPSSEDFWNSLPAQIAAKTAPDLVKVTNEGAFEYINKGLFVPIDEHIQKASLDMSGYADSVKDIWTIDNKLYAIPVSVAPSMFFINKKMWAEAGLGNYPTTWDEVEVAAEKLTKDDVKGLVINVHPYHLTNYALSYGGGWGNGTTINSDANVKAMEKVVSLFEKGVAVTPKEEGYGWDGEVFANGKGAMTTGGYWYKGFLTNAAPDLEYAVMPMPQGTTKSCTSHSDAFVVLKDAVDPEAAVKAAHYLTRDSALEEFMAKVGTNPAKPALSSKYFEVNPEFKLVEEMIPHGKDFGYPADTKKFNDVLIQKMEEKVLTKSNTSIKEILDEIQSQFN